MNRIPVSSIPSLPDSLQEFVRGGILFDSSCSEDARVWLSRQDGDLYIKTAAAGTLHREAEMNAFFHSRGLGPEVLAYLPGAQDWLVTRAIPAEDCLYAPYLEDPGRLSALLGELLRQLHETDPTGCPVTDLSSTLYPGHPGLLTERVLCHGDYCLPNVMLHNWQFSGFIDVGQGGIGDRHIDLYWGCWSILYNLKEEKWCSRFLDAYGRKDVVTETLQILHQLENP